MGAIVYRGFDQEALDAQYNCRGMVPDFEDHMARWAGLNRQAFDSFETRIDLAYGDRPAEKLDIFLPGGSGPHPLMIFIHGGYWRAMDKENHAFPALSFVPDGIALASINYTLAPAADMDRIVHECRAAIAWCAQNAAELNIDADRIHVSGHSAGGHLTAMMAATDWPGFAADLPADLLKSASPLSGLFDLAPILQTSINADVRMDPAAATRNSPQALKPAHDMPMTVAVGGAESDEFRRQSKEFAEYWGRSLSRIDYLETPGENHFTIIDGIARAGSPITRALLGHMGL